MNGASRRIRRPAPGFTLVELLVTVGLIGVLAAVSVPVVGGAVRRLTFNSAARAVAGEIRAARYAAVAKNRTEVLRFNCPGLNQYRVVEFTGIAAIDGAADRCSPAVYPFPDLTPGVAPDGDGPVRQLPDGLTFSQSGNLTFDATGRIPAIVTIEVDNGTQRRAIIVQASGRVAEQ